ncbi:MAG: hypothetical protein QOF87_1384, partial [Pseudonocardiales bacterium]|nr:hypothetical protein [Pseudonocardiales bacterium]
YKFPVVPSSQVQVTLGNLAQNYDLTLYDDIGAAFTTLTTTTDLNTLGAEQSGNAYSPSIYSPSIYSPSIYSPSIYSPSIYSPSIYSPSIYSPSIYSPSIYSPSIYSPSIYSPSIYSPSIYSPSIYSPSDAFLQAFSGAQARSLIGISAQDGTAAESIGAATWNNNGFFYVRVQGRNGEFSPTPFHVGLATTGGPCTNITLNSFATLPTLTGTPGGARNVILEDTSRLTQTAAQATDVARLATATQGAVVDVSRSQRVVALNRQADASPSCAFAKNLVAQATREIVNSYRDANGTLKYVSIIGGDSAIPFFRYPDTAGLGPEVNYVPPVLGTSASQASLQGNNVLGQDAYGAVDDLSLKGSVLPVPDLAVGRLVETSAEIDGQIQQFLGFTNQTLPTPTSSLVTGYDFLTSAADAVEADLQAGLATGARNDQLITNQGVPTTTTTPATGPTRTASWTATDLSNALFGAHHDLVFLAGHFSANNTLAADYATSLATSDVAARPNAFRNTLVFSAGCHSGYNLVDGDGVPGLTVGLDWAQAMAQQRAILIAGTGYQYADTNFLAYSAKLYTLFSHELRTGVAGTPVAVGQALVKAKQAYLEGLGSVGGIDQKSIIQSTLYGLPMTGLNLPRRIPAPTTSPAITPSPVPAGTPGDVLNLRTADLPLSTPTDPHTSPVLDLNGNSTGANFSWLSGPDGVSTQPALPALPQQFVDATSTADQSLRGVGLRSATYTDSPGVIPLTGAPTTEQNGLHTTFSSPDFFPQRLFAINYFDAIGTSNSGGQTRLIVTPAQYRSDSPGSTTNTLRTYSNLGLSLYYSSNTTKYGQNTPALAQSPSISQVTSTVNDNSTVTINAHVSGDPSAGIQQVWVTYTGERGPFHGVWTSLDLRQNASDSTLWSGSLNIPTGQNPADVRFVVQAVNGVGGVGFDNNLGADYTPVAAQLPNPPAPVPTELTLDPVPSSVAYGSTLNVGATLTGAPAGSVVTFDIGQGSVAGTTDANGHATAAMPIFANVGPHQLTAGYAGDAERLSSSAQSPTFTETKAPSALAIVVAKVTVTPSSTPQPKLPLRNIDPGVVATLTSGGRPLLQKAVVFTLTDLITKAAVTASRATDLNGKAKLGILTIRPGLYRVTAAFGTTQAGTAVDPVFAQSTSPAVFVLLVPGLAVRIE